MDNDIPNPFYGESLITRLKAHATRREKELKMNPRYDIDNRANEKGELRLFFANFQHLQDFLDGKPTIASTERFLETDLIWAVPKEKVNKITDGQTLAHLNQKS